MLRSLSARDPRSARAWAALALMVTIATCLLTNLVTFGALHAPELTATLGLAAVSAVLLGVPAERAAPLVVLAPLAGVAAVVWLDLLSRDAGVTGQVFLVVPVIWAAAQLRPGGTAVVALATVVGEAVVAFSILPPGEAAAVFAYVTVFTLLVAGVLTRGGVIQERLVEQLRVQAGTDPLTGLVTRRVLDAATDRAVRARGCEGALVVIDLDRFKTVNDTHGHLGGDAALAHVAALLTARCRPGDVVARMGGDELAVLMLDCPADVAVRRAQCFVDAVRDEPLRLPGGTVVPLSISAGLTPLSPAVTGAQDLYARADSALYAAKRAGRDRLARAA
ncbi:diguanylate cyclase (GGDEF)-like protein [Kineococcus radiotolerans]|uniref:Diguanylate cyclase n=2 Tax=Kineococcus radiotolerans TaxID=131568 RepID=A6W451_KINRD|nr:GGDEF domain-containing protein [Kineococcus radiotolerans]ABS01590.1 diguanylate cyclase [Kineococcus radiotolerans SRS30216 = ATCC BAA-149]MBB2901283.1 diguanylate cyclase (GGDEF)-like protein [Kineococcus radiotolerans]